MIRVLIISLMFLSACDTAGPGFRGADAIHREVEGSQFTLRFRGDMVEAIRTSPEMLPRFEDVARKATLAVLSERPGCTAAWVEGDPAMILLGLACDGAKPPKKPKRQKLLLCDLYGITARDGLANGMADCQKL